METQDSLLALVPLLPLLGSIVVYLLTNRNKSTHPLAGWIATGFAASSFAVVCVLATRLAHEGALVHTFWEWFHVGTVQVDFALRFDALTRVMTFIITGVGSLIHLYAIGYMHEDENQPRFFCYLNLFLFAMLTLVLGDSLLLLFVGWEGVGLCSYLLIGFWFKEMPNAEAGQKAFVVNRIGDAGFILGMFLLIVTLGTVNIAELAAGIGGVSPRIIEIAAFLLFVGAVGKSAQIPLFVWLPDAMAGPTPVSALIHAATMVTAGVYMITRMSFLFSAAPTTMAIIMVVGTATAFVAATVAIAQNDIKKVLAYSTVSQLGYMFMALGAGAFSYGIYHVVTHAFFKACLFMGAGSVIIGCHHEQDMRQFGGLRKSMPWTFVTYLVATLAISGIPFLSGFFSKDAILYSVASAYNVPMIGEVPINTICWFFGIVTAMMTAFYMTRSLVMTFFGEYRGHAHPHESPWVVTVPLVILAAFSAGFGLLYGEKLLHMLEPWTRADLLVSHEKLEHSQIYLVNEYSSIAAALFGVALSFFIYLKRTDIADQYAKALSGLHKALLNKWWFDELYAAVIIAPLRAFSSVMFKLFDRIIIDGTVNGIGTVIEANGEMIRKVQMGRMSVYALLMFSSMVLITVFWLLG